MKNEERDNKNKGEWCNRQKLGRRRLTTIYSNRRYRQFGLIGNVLGDMEYTCYRRWDVGARVPDGCGNTMTYTRVMRKWSPNVRKAVRWRAIENGQIGHESGSLL